VFYLQKFVSSFLELPGLFITIFFLMALIFLLKKNKRLFATFLILACAFYFISTDISINLLVRPYENQFSEMAIPLIKPEETVIVVFSGGVIRGVESDDQHGDQIGPHSMMRLFKAFQVYEKTGAQVIIAGGNVYDKPGESISAVMGSVMESWGVPKEKIDLEQRSKTTYENAIYSLAMLDKTVKNIILVTSALHMPRAYRTFQTVIEREKEDHLQIIPDPGDYRVENVPMSFSSFLPNSGSLDIFSAAFHEWLGNLFYLLK